MNYDKERERIMEEVNEWPEEELEALRYDIQTFLDALAEDSRRAKGDNK
jgi:hypothetical protein